MTNPVIDCLLNHRTVRKYKQEPVEPEKVELILKAGTRAATGGNLQLYTFVVIEDEKRKKALDAAWEQRFVSVAKSPLVIIALADQYRVRRWLEAHSDRPICNTKSQNLLLAVWDALIALQNMVVAAESLGLGTCYIGSILSMDIQRLLGAPEHVFPAGLVCMGYPDESPDLSMRLPMEAVVHRDYYCIPTDQNIADWYRERDNVWETVSDRLKKKLAEENIHGIAQALAVQKFSQEIVTRRSRGIIENLARSGFELRPTDQD